jgi:hypothetical protein
VPLAKTVKRERNNWEAWTEKKSLAGQSGALISVPRFSR